MTQQFKIISLFEDKLHFDVVVGMAVYIKDRLDWVEQAVASILQQTYKDYLYVIVMDGEVKDDVLTFLLDLARKNQHVVLVDGKHNKGLSTCMNFVIDWSLQFQPRYFFRMDADDISHIERLNKQVAFLNANLDVSVLGTALEEINEQGKVVGKRMLPLSHKEIVKFLPKRCSINHPTVAIRYTVFENGFRYREDLRNIEDYFLWTELVANGFIFTNLSETLIKFRRANDFYVRRGIDKSVSEFKARLFAMKTLKKRTLGNFVYALAVFFLRLMPKKIIKIAYIIDRQILEKLVKH